MTPAKILGLRLGPVTYELVRSEPLELDSHRLIVVARVLSLTRRGATVGWTRAGGWGMHAASVSPVALIEERPGLRRLQPIVDLNKLILWALGGACFATILAVRGAHRALEDRRPGRATDLRA